MTDDSNAARGGSVARMLGPSEADLDRARALLDPLRWDLYDAISVDGPLTLDQLQERFPESRGALRFDLGDLTEVGHISVLPGDPPTWAAQPGSMQWDGAMLRDPVGGAAMAELDRIVIQRRVNRTRDWSHHRAHWGPRWEEASLSADFVTKMNADELDAMRTELEDVARKHARAAQVRRAQSPSDDDQTVFTVLMGFPCRIGNEPPPITAP